MKCMKCFLYELYLVGIELFKILLGLFKAFFVNKIRFWKSF